MRRAAVPAKINLSLVVGPTRADGLHELTSIFQRVDIADRLSVELLPPDGGTSVDVVGFSGDTLIRQALERLIAASGSERGLRATVKKEIPVAAGLGGGSADAGVALRLAHELIDSPLSQEQLSELAFELGADVPFFLSFGPQLVEGAGERLSGVSLPQDYWIVLALPDSVEKPSTAEIYRRVDEAGAARGYPERRDQLLAALASLSSARDLARLPGNDLAPFAGGAFLARQLLELGALRADVSGAGPAAYGLFLHERIARSAIEKLRGARRSWLTVPVW